MKLQNRNRERGTMRRDSCVTPGSTPFPDITTVSGQSPLQAVKLRPFYTNGFL